MKKITYSSVVGCTIYAIVCSRPDLTYGIRVVNRFMANLGKHHWHAVKRMLRYLKRNIRHGILYGRTDKASNHVIGYLDSDLACDLDKKRSIIVYVFTLCGGIVSWKASL